MRPEHIRPIDSTQRECGIGCPHFLVDQAERIAGRGWLTVLDLRLPGPDRGPKELECGDHVRNARSIEHDDRASPVDHHMRCLRGATPRVQEKAAKGGIEPRRPDQKQPGRPSSRRFVNELQRATELGLHLRPLAAKQRRERTDILSVGMIGRRQDSLGKGLGAERPWVGDA